MHILWFITSFKKLSNQFDLNFFLSDAYCHSIVKQRNGKEKLHKLVSPITTKGNKDTLTAGKLLM